MLWSGNINRKWKYTSKIVLNYNTSTNTNMYLHSTTAYLIFSQVTTTVRVNQWWKMSRELLLEQK